MLKKLVLKNIGRFEDETIELGQIMRIEGSNNSGKSIGFFNPIRTMMLGEDFPKTAITRGKKEAWMELHFDDDRIIKYHRKGSTQDVTLVYADGTVKNYVTINQSCRDEITKFAGGCRIKLDKNEKPETPQFVPISAQQVYMIEGLSGATVLRRLSNITGSAELAVAKQQLQSEKRLAEAELKAFNKVFDDANSQKEVYDRIDLENIQSLLEYVEDIEDSIRTLELLGVNADNAIKGVTIYKNTKSVYDKYIQKLDVLIKSAAVDSNLLEDMNKNAAGVTATLDSIDDYLKTIKDIKREIATLDATIEELKKTQKVCPTCGKEI